MHSPSLDNLKSSLKISQKHETKPSVINSPYSDEIEESERQANDDIKPRTDIRSRAKLVSFDE
jgi:hypothetical protein